MTNVTCLFALSVLKILLTIVSVPKKGCRSLMVHLPKERVPGVSCLEDGLEKPHLSLFMASVYCCLPPGLRQVRRGDKAGHASRLFS